MVVAAAVSVLLVTGIGDPAHAQMYEWQKVFPSDSAPTQWFGCEVAVSGNLAIVGARHDEQEGADAGAAYIFEFDGTSWSEVIKLAPETIGPGMNFGAAVDIHCCAEGAFAIVGAPFWEDWGEAYIFEDTGEGWQQVARFETTPDGLGDRYGASVAISHGVMAQGGPSRWAAVGAPGSWLNDFENRVFVYERTASGWQEVQRLLPPSGETGISFGSQVAAWHFDVSEFGRIVVGAPTDSEHGTNAGAVFSYSRNFMVDPAWQYREKITPSDPVASSRFGSNLGTISLEECFVASADEGAAGAAYVFRIDQDGLYEQSARLVPPSGRLREVELGVTSMIPLELSAALGVSTDDDRGAVHLFDEDGSGWAHTGEVRASDGWVDDHFGAALAYTGSDLLVGAYGVDDHGGDCGAVYFYRDQTDNRLEGDVWSDDDGDGVQDSGEAGLSSWRVYLDLDDDGTWDDQTEPSRLTAASGHYSFVDLAPGHVVVRVDAPEDWTPTHPADGFHDVVMEVSGTVDGVDFGYLFMPPPPYDVCPDGSGIHATIQEALDVASAGDIIRLCDGVFAGPGNTNLFVTTDDVTIQSVSGDPADCIIDGGGTDPAFAQLRGATLRGLTIENCFSDGFVPVAVESDRAATVENCRFEDNQAHALVVNGPCTVIECTFVGNGYSCVTTNDLCVVSRSLFSNNGSGINCEGATITASEFTGQANQAVTSSGDISVTDSQFTGNGNQNIQGGAINWTGGPGRLEITGSVFDGNTAQWGGAVSCTGVLEEACEIAVESSTFHGNSADAGSSFYLLLDFDVSLRNTIICAGTSGAAMFELGAFTVTMDVQCCDVHGNAGGDWVGPLEGFDGSNGNFSADPMFEDPDQGDFCLQLGSPCNALNSPGDCGLIGAEDLDVTGIPDVPAADATVQLSSFPNPFNPSVTITFELPGAGPTTLAVYDVGGHLVASLLRHEALAAGHHEIRWDGRDEMGRAVASGTYFARITAGPRSGMGRMTLIR
jgi:hypothetical protein